jgi:hypothetical protein
VAKQGEARPNGARLGVDIGGTFTDVALETRGQRFSAKILTTPHAPEHGVLAAIHSGARTGGAKAGRFIDHHPRHDARDQRDHRAQGRQDRAGDHRGVSRHDRNPSREPLRAVRRQYRPAAALGAAPAALGRERADRRARPRRHPARRSGGDEARPAARSRWRRKRRDWLSAQLRQSRARAAHARSVAAAYWRRDDDAVLRRIARDARIRAALDGLRQRLCPADDGPLSGQSRNTAA